MLVLLPVLQHLAELEEHTGLVPSIMMVSTEGYFRNHFISFPHEKRAQY